MWSKILQDWTQLGGDAGTLVQSEPSWLPTDLFQDAVFQLDVRYVNASRLYLTYETAPSRDDVLFLPMVPSQSIDMTLLVGTTTVQPCLAHATDGPPLASWLRWKLTGVGASWVTCLRITMFGI